MARTNSTKPPSYRLHKATGQAVVTINRKDHYLGKHGSPESRLRYERLISQWLQNPGTTPALEPVQSTDITVVELCAQFLRWATTYYQKNGEETTELTNVKRAIRSLRECYPALPAKDFSPLKLDNVRERLIKDGLCRTNVNRYARLIVRIFAYGVEKELFPSAVVRDGEHHAIVDGLRQVRPLQKGRCKAPETEPVGPVDDDDIEATIEHLSPRVRAMVKVQLLLACRPGELVTMRPRDIDRSRAVWIYRPEGHKTEHHGKSRIIPIGPRAQLLLAEWLPPFPDQYVWRSQRGPHFTAAGYGVTIRRACLEAGIKPWSPNRLRHSGATRIREQMSLDAAQVILGHSSISTTQVYAEKNLTAALKIAAEVG
jgi:integrase